jgi:hypothetical protein
LEGGTGRVARLSSPKKLLLGVWAAGPAAMGAARARREAAVVSFIFGGLVFFFDSLFFSLFFFFLVGFEKGEGGEYLYIQLEERVVVKTCGCPRQKQQTVVERIKGLDNPSCWSAPYYLRERHCDSFFSFRRATPRAHTPHTFIYQ